MTTAIDSTSTFNRRASSGKTAANSRDPQRARLVDAAAYARHLLVVRKADRGDVLFQPPSERGFPDAEETVDQVSRCHNRCDGAGRTLFWAIRQICDKRGTRRCVALIMRP